MEASEIAIRPADPDDARAMAEIRGAAIPYLVQTWRGMQSRLRDAEQSAAFLAVKNDHAVGYAAQRRPHDGGTRFTLVVHPAHRRRGVGTALLARCVDQAKADGATLIHSVADDDGACELARAHGFEVGRSHQFSGVDLDQLPPVEPPPSGVRVVPLEEIDPYEVWMIHDATSPDDPSGLSISQPYETWRAEDWDFPDHAADLGMGAFDGDELVAFTHVFADRERGRIWSAMTGVRRDHRGRGLARLVKSASLHRAAESGIRQAYTGNDSSNHAMLAVNQALGYRMVGRTWSVRRSLID